MDQAQARALLAGERARLQRLLQAATGEPQVAELGDDVDDADRRNADQTGMAVDQLLRARWAALQRAEARLAAGSYGRSVASGQAIQLCLLSWSFSRSFHRPQLNLTRPDSPETPPNLTWLDPTEP
jgi:DnaK suppressor protein